MKKLTLLIVFIFGITTAMNSQTFKLGASAGIPTADAGDISSFVLGVDAYYYFTNVDAFAELGLNAGFRNYFGEEISDGIEIDDTQFLPLAAAARLKLFGILSGGADIGYAIGISDFVDGGFYFRPVVGIDIADTIELFASYEVIADEATWGSLNAGILFEF
ncbi:hypothetical protein [Salegentibacter sp. BLCTC]|uniref:hypothetical protein n=1 Tax=Salegentibacter sp. BLCTC TaxID=2697368 RepID=UPI00187B2286|nr:hypothetical protein [Salegentibacter sp. BLCTC]